MLHVYNGPFRSANHSSILNFENCWVRVPPSLPRSSVRWQATHAGRRLNIVTKRPETERTFRASRHSLGSQGSAATRRGGYKFLQRPISIRRDCRAGPSSLLLKIESDRILDRVLRARLLPELLRQEFCLVFASAILLPHDELGIPSTACTSHGCYPQKGNPGTRIRFGTFLRNIRGKDLCSSV